LVETVEYGDGQDWIGFLLCPSAVKQMEGFGLNIKERLNYVPGSVPFKDNFHGDKEAVAACILGNWVQLNGKNECLEKLKEMKERISDICVSNKYERTIKFIEANQRVFNSGV